MTSFEDLTPEQKKALADYAKRKRRNKARNERQQTARTVKAWNQEKSKEGASHARGGTHPKEKRYVSGTIL